MQEQHNRDYAVFGPVRDFGTLNCYMVAIFDILTVGNFFDVHAAYKSLCCICLFSLLASAGECEA